MHKLLEVIRVDIVLQNDVGLCGHTSNSTPIKMLSKLFQNLNCKGTVLINSTVGYQSLYHSIPVKSLGITPYNIKGLSHQEDLTSFFKNPSPVDKLLFNKFYKYILENSQINGNFDGFFPFNNVFVTRK